MNNRQESKLRMYRLCDRVLKAYKQDVDTVAALAREAAHLDTTITEIDTIHKKQSVDSKGVTVSRNQLREEVAESANMMAGALFSYGTHKGDADLCQRTNVYPSILMKASQAEFIRITSEIASECEKAGANLAEYGISAEAITQYASKVEEYKKISTAPRNSKVEKSTATSQLEELFQKCDDILLNHIDVLVLQFKKAASQLYNDYNNARIIEDHGSRKPKDKKSEAPAA